MRTDSGEAFRLTAGFLWMCQGYYRHTEGYTPEWPGMVDYQGRIVHPQTWPKDIELAGKKVVVIGSGATAATLLPNIADDCAHVTMLQRSPTYFIPARNANDLADQLRQLEVDESWIHEIVRRRILRDQSVFTQRSFDEPEKVRSELLAGVRAYLGPDYDIATHFTPSYRPWRQRIAFVPDGDLFRAIAKGRASVVNRRDRAVHREGHPFEVRTGARGPTSSSPATGFHLNVLGDIAFSIDGKPLDFAQSVTYRGMMFTGVPNMAWVFGYFPRQLDAARRPGRRLRLPPAAAHEGPAGAPSRGCATSGGQGHAGAALIDPENFNPGYLMRGMHLLPKRGDKREWQHTQDYWQEKNEFSTIDLDDAAFVYG